MAWPILVAALAMQAYDRKRKQDEAKRQAQAEPYRQLAAEMRAPTYGVEAVRRRKYIDDIEGDDYLGPALALNKKLEEEEGDDYLKDLFG